MSYHIGKLREIVVSVTNLKRHLETWHDYMGWQVRYQGRLDGDMLKFWHLSLSTHGAETLCAFPNAEHGLLRLVKFDSVEQQQIRGGAQIWEPGGIVDFDLRTSSVHTTFRDMVHQLGWFSYGEPIEFSLGAVTVQEALLYGPDRVALALVHRLNPVLTGVPEHQGILGSVYLSMMVAENLPKSIEFFVKTLGFHLHENTSFVLPNDAPNVFRLPWNLAAHHPVRFVTLSPDNTRDTMLGLFHFEGLQGKNYAERAVPPNTGLLMYRFTVSNIAEYYQTLLARGVQPVSPLTEVVVRPYGKAQAFAVRSPDGVWIEFFELLNS
jgi:catechol 2,3-dioxygenase-like lactoylglutathione lyase family enzyme